MENYKEKFENFLSKMQRLLGNAEKQGHIIVRVEDLQNAFPELKESEDEKAMEEIKQLIQCMHDADPRKERWLAWLEKQGESKWSEEDNRNLGTAILALERPFEFEGKHERDRAIDWLKSLKQRME